MLVYTSLLFLVPAMVAGWVGVGWFAVLMSGLVATSLCYHGGVFETSICRLVDTCYACGLTAIFTTIALYLGMYRGLLMFKLAAACGFTATAIYAISKSKILARACKPLHACVHMCGALGFTLFACGAGLLAR
jgi:hypothetical protein